MVASMAEVPKTTYRLSASVRPLCLGLPFSILSNPDLCSLKGSRREGGRPAVILSVPIHEQRGQGKSTWTGKRRVGGWKYSFLVFCLWYRFHLLRLRLFRPQLSLFLG